jgi:hypothetical protein
MPLPKQQLSDSFDDALRRLLEPGERVQAAAFVIPGPSPMAIGFIGALVQAVRGQSDGWLAVTDRRVVFYRATLLTQRPKGFGWADPRHAVEIGEVHDDERSGWEWLVFRRPDGEVLRLNASVVWQDEFRAIVAALTEPAPPPPEDWAP